MQPTLEAPGAKRLKLMYDEPLSKIAFNFNLCRYYLCRDVLQLQATPEFRFYRGKTQVHVMRGASKTKLGWAAQVDSIKTSVESAWFQRLKLKCDEVLSRFAFNLNLRRYRLAAPL